MQTLEQKLNILKACDATLEYIREKTLNGTVSLEMIQKVGKITAARSVVCEAILNDKEFNDYIAMVTFDQQNGIGRQADNIISKK